MTDLIKFIKLHKIAAIINFILALIILWFIISWLDVISTNGIDGTGCHCWNLFKILFN